MVHMTQQSIRCILVQDFIFLFSVATKDYLMYLISFLQLFIQSTHMADTKDSLLSDQDNYQHIIKKNRFDGLRTLDIWAYGVGHFVNDLASTCWFNYLLYFLTKVVKTEAAPYAILSGQIADGIATPLVGYLSDKTNTRFGQRKPWYIFGLVVVMVAFLPTFQNFSKFSNNKSLQVAYYIFFPSLFNVGWASLQISHMSLVPSLSCSRKRRDILNNLRNTFTFISNLTVLALGLLIFSTMSNPTLQINLLSYIVATLGLGASLFFLFVIDEVKLTEISKQKSEQLKHQLLASQQSAIKQRKKSSNSTTETIVTEFSQDQNLQIKKSQRNKQYKIDKWYDWFAVPSFYIFGFCYMGVRLYSNLFGTLLPFYLVYVLKLGASDSDSNKIPFTIALIQLLIYITSVITSLCLSKFYTKFGRKTALMFGGVFCIITALSMIFLNKNFSWPIYIIALFIGMAQSMVLSTGINLISEVIGSRSKEGAIVFGIYSLLDKFSSGIAIFVISNSTAFKNNDELFIRLTTIIIPSLACILACLVVLFTPIQEYKTQNKVEDSTTVSKRKSSLEEELVM